MEVNFANMAYIRKSPFLRCLDPRLQEVLCDKMTLKKFERVSAFQHYGRPLTGLWFVRNGEVEVRNPEAEVLARLPSGSCFGEQVLSDAACFTDDEAQNEHLVSPVTFVAAASTELLQLSVSDYKKTAMGNYFFPRSAVREAAESLGECPQLQHLPLSKRIDIAENTIAANFKRGAYILQQGRISSNALLVLSGDVLVCHQPFGAATTERVCLGRPGALYGTRASSQCEKQQVDIIAQGAVQCRIIPVLALQKHLQQQQLADLISSDGEQVTRWVDKAHAIAEEKRQAGKLSLKQSFLKIPNSSNGAAVGTGFAQGQEMADNAFVAHDVARATASLLPAPVSPVVAKERSEVVDVDAIVDAPVTVYSHFDPDGSSEFESDLQVSTSFLRLPSPRPIPQNDFGDAMSPLERTSVYLEPPVDRGGPPRRKTLRPLPRELRLQRPFTPLETKAVSNALSATSLMLHSSAKRASVALVQRPVHSLSNSRLGDSQLMREQWPTVPKLPPPLDPLAHAAESGYWDEKRIPKHARQPRRSSAVLEAHRMHERMIQRMRLMEQRARLGGRQRSNSLPSAQLRGRLTKQHSAHNLSRQAGTAQLPRDIFLGLNASPVRLQPVNHRRHNISVPLAGRS